VALARLAENGIHPPHEMPFLVPWTDRAGEPGFTDDFVGYHLRARDEWAPERWHLLLGVWADGSLAGVQGLEASDFAGSRTAATGSWLGRPFQGRGYGTEMRAAMLGLLFDGLGGETAMSGAIEGNVASARVSEKLGYAKVGEGVVSPRGTPVREQWFSLGSTSWTPPFPIGIIGLAPCLPLFGL
jgi:RimJ/RimL family protein N-acetyltransferase